MWIFVFILCFYSYHTVITSISEQYYMYFPLEVSNILDRGLKHAARLMWLCGQFAALRTVLFSFLSAKCGPRMYLSLRPLSKTTYEISSQVIVLAANVELLYLIGSHCVVDIWLRNVVATFDVWSDVATTDATRVAVVCRGIGAVLNTLVFWSHFDFSSLVSIFDLDFCSIFCTLELGLNDVFLHFGELWYRLFLVCLVCLN